jgi:hypothetical protein
VSLPLRRKRSCRSFLIPSRIASIPPFPHVALPWGTLAPRIPMLARVRSAAVLGIDAYLVDVETD